MKYPGLTLKNCTEVLRNGPLVYHYFGHPVFMFSVQLFNDISMVRTHPAIPYRAMFSWSDLRVGMFQSSVHGQSNIYLVAGSIIDLTIHLSTGWLNHQLNQIAYISELIWKDILDSFQTLKPPPPKQKCNIP